MMISTEQKLKKLFDFQKFEQNQTLSKMIEEAESERVMLTDEELEQVAAGLCRSDKLPKEDGT